MIDLPDRIGPSYVPDALNPAVFHMRPGDVVSTVRSYGSVEAPFDPPIELPAGGIIVQGTSGNIGVYVDNQRVALYRLVDGRFVRDNEPAAT